MPPAARVGDNHICPLVTPGGTPHVGGPVIGPGVPTVTIGGMPACVLGDSCTCAGPPDTVISGSGTVTIGGAPAVRLGDSTAHGGTVMGAAADVMIGG